MIAIFFVLYACVMRIIIEQKNTGFNSLGHLLSQICQALAKLGPIATPSINSTIKQKSMTNCRT